VINELLTSKAKKLLFTECALFSITATVLLALVFSRNYTLHFEQVTLNVYTNGTSDFTTNVTSLVRSLGTVAIFSLIFGVATGAAIGLTCSHNAGASSSTNPNAYEEEVTKTGLVVINKTNEGTTYQLTELGRRFLKEYRFLDKNTKAIA
jgi:hypothetical protein